jgi:glycosyltransferase involved in cell wall biosynthesis
MKVLVVRNAASYDFGGAERLAVHIAKELELNGIEAMVVSRHKQLLRYAQSTRAVYKKGWWWGQQSWSGTRALWFPVYLLWQGILTIWYLQLILRTHPDILHLMSKDDFIAGTLAARLLNKGVVWTDPADLKHVFRNHNIWYKNPIGKLVYAISPLAGSVTLVSESERILITESVGHPLPENFIVMHIAGKDEKVEAERRKPEDKDAVIFCATSRLVIAKGIGDLIEAFNELTKNSDNYRLWLVGNGPDEERFRAEAKGNIYITFLGHSDKPLAYVAAADVFVHPTHHEGFSLSLAEAAMLSKPMIATNVGGNPELVNDNNGLLVPVKDPAAFCAAMRELGGDQNLRERLGKNARHDYVTKFDFSTIVKETLVTLYEKSCA